MFLKLLIPSYQKYIELVITQNTSFQQVLDTIIKKCKEFNFICGSENIRCLIQDVLITEENWEKTKNIHTYKNVNGVIIIVPITCEDHCP